MHRAILFLSIALAASAFGQTAPVAPTDRATNVFINLRDNPELDTLKFAPIGRALSAPVSSDTATDDRRPISRGPYAAPSPSRS